MPEGDLRHAELSGGDVGRWTAYWRRNPIAAWTGEKREGRTWFHVDSDDRFTLDLSIAPELVAALTQMTRELVDYRLAWYLTRKRRSDVSVEGFACKIIWNQRDPIVRLPPRTGITVPNGETDVRLPDGSIWQFRFASQFCNVARPAGVERNQLPDLLRQWFGPRAGQPGTDFHIRFYAGPDGLWVEPLRATVVDIGTRGRIVAYPDLRVAAGQVGEASKPPDTESTWLAYDNASPDLFAVRVAGTSMDGGPAPMRDGDWAVMRLSRGQPASALENRVVMVEVGSSDAAARYQIKRLRRGAGQWRLVSDNAEGPTIDAGSDMVVIARLESVISPSNLAPSVGTVLTESELASAFGLDELEPRSGRYQGHVFIVVTESGHLPEPDRVRWSSNVALNPSETAFVLGRTADEVGYRYLGVAHQTTESGLWQIAAVDYATWRTYGVGRAVSRRLPEKARARAQIIIDAILRRPDADRWLQRVDGNHARVLGPAAQGGMRIDGGPGGFSGRTVSLIDIAWVVVAADDVVTHGGIVDEARVNRFRYLEGVPRSATRWIDTGWAIAAWQMAKEDI